MRCNSLKYVALNLSFEDSWVKSQIVFEWQSRFKVLILKLYCNLGYCAMHELVHWLQVTCPLGLCVIEPTKCYLISTNRTLYFPVWENCVGYFKVSTHPKLKMNCTLIFVTAKLLNVSTFSDSGCCVRHNAYSCLWTRWLVKRKTIYGRQTYILV